MPQVFHRLRSLGAAQRQGVDDFAVQVARFDFVQQAGQPVKQDATLSNSSPNTTFIRRALFQLIDD